MLVVGLTGGIGSGKSTVAKLFADHKIAVVDADKIAHEFSRPGESVFNEIVKYFGKEILTENHTTINRKRLREIVFNNLSKRRWLEQLLHPLILFEMEGQISMSESAYTIAAIPLLVECWPINFVNRIVVVDIPTDIQLKRVMERDQMTQAQAQRILDSQSSREQRLAAAHDVIDNTGEVGNLKAQVDKLHDNFLRLSK